jgi:Penicillin binding protein transpeptidase domain/NTF2-like N-terminal transpeptidase domain
VSYPPQDSGQGDSYDESEGAQQGYEAFAAGFSEHGGPPRRPRTGIIVAVSIAAVAAVVAAIVIVVIVKAAPGGRSTGGSQSTAALPSTASPAAALATTASPSAASSPADAEQVTTAFLQAWSSGDIRTAAGLTDDPSAAQAALTAYAQDLNLRKLAGTMTGSAVGAPGASPGTGAAAAASSETVTVQLTAEVASSSSTTTATGSWSYHSTLVAYQRAGGPGWVIQWQPDIVAPNLTAGQHLATVVVPPQGVSVTDSAGTPLSSYDDPGLSTIASLLSQKAPAGMGSPGLSVQIEDAADHAMPGSQAVVTPPKMGQLTTTISPQAERAARAAVSQAQGSAIVAIEPSTGHILAIANNSGFNDFALTASVAPGSTMKIITSTALINSGLTSASSPVSCPATYTVPQGQTFTNDAGGSEPAGTPFSYDFAQSCNNAFTQWWGDLSGKLASTASTYYGLNQPWNLGIPGESATYFNAPATASGSELAGEAIGEGQLTASPLAMASVAATVDSGQFRQPVLIPAGVPTVSVAPLPPGTDSQLQTMMRDVVTEGTAAGIGLGPDVYAKTGTADVQGQEQPNSWMVAFAPDKNVAVAAMVLNAGYGAQVAGPEVKTFLGMY